MASKIVGEEKSIPLLAFPSQVNRPGIRDDVIAGNMENIEKVDRGIAMGDDEFKNLPEFHPGNWISLGDLAMLIPPPGIL